MSFLLFDRRSEVAPSLPEVLDTPCSSWHVGGVLVFSHHQPGHLPVPGTSLKLPSALFSPPTGPGCSPFLHAFCFAINDSFVCSMQRGFFPRNGSPMIARGWRKPSPVTEWLPQPQLCQLSLRRQQLGLHWCVYLCSGPH